MVGSQLWVRLNFAEERRGSRLSTNYGGSDLVAVDPVPSDSSRWLVQSILKDTLYTVYSTGVCTYY